MKVKVESEKFGLKLNIQKTRIMASSPVTSWQIDAETVETVLDVLFLVWSNIPLGYDKPRQHIKKQTHYFANKGLSSQGYRFSSGHVYMWELDWRKLSAEELMLLNCGVGEDSWESLGLQGNLTSPS